MDHHKRKTHLRRPRVSIGEFAGYALGSLLPFTADGSSSRLVFQVLGAFVLIAVVPVSFLVRDEVEGGGVLLRGGRSDKKPKSGSSRMW